MFYSQLRCLGSRFWDGDWLTGSLLGSAINICRRWGKEAGFKQREKLGYFAVSKNLWSTSTKKVNLECLFRDFSTWGLAGPDRLYPPPTPPPPRCYLDWSLAVGCPRNGFLFSTGSSQGGLAAGGCLYTLPGTGGIRPLVPKGSLNSIL